MAIRASGETSTIADADPGRPGDIMGREICGGCEIIPDFSYKYSPIFPNESGPIDDIRLSPYRPIRQLWAGEQRKGGNLCIEDAFGDRPHGEGNVPGILHAADIPLPPEIPESLTSISHTKTEDLRAFWIAQLGRLETWIGKRSPSHGIRGDVRPDVIRQTGIRLKTAALLQLLRKKDIGGSEWLKHLPIGFPIVGNLSQAGIYPGARALARPKTQLAFGHGPGVATGKGRPIRADKMLGRDGPNRSAS